MLSRKTARFLAELYKDEYSYINQVSSISGRRQRIFTLMRDELELPRFGGVFRACVSSL